MLTGTKTTTNYATVSQPTPKGTNRKGMGWADGFIDLRIGTNTNAPKLLLISN